jgi:hypothetical protein
MLKLPRYYGISQKDVGLYDMKWKSIIWWLICIFQQYFAIFWFKYLKNFTHTGTPSYVGLYQLLPHPTYF